MRISTLVKTIAITSTLLIGAVYANVDKVVELDLHDKHYKQDSIIKLKQITIAYYPNLKLERFDLQSIKLVAKSRKGQGTAKLVVGKSSTDKKVIAGIPSEFHETQSYTFDRMTFFNPKNNSHGVWQIHLKGNIKVRKIKLRLERKSDRPTRPTRTTKPSKTASCKVVLETFWGQDITKFTETAKGRTLSIAKDKACGKALVKCQDAKASFGDLGNLGMCTIAK